MELSKRLQTIADMVTCGNTVADIGCDHGFVSIYLFLQGIAPKVYAMDVRTGPLARAREHIDSYGLSAYIETRLSDGLTALREGEADTIICAGMGGRLMEKILREGYGKAVNAGELVLQPQSEIGSFRAFLRTHGFRIVQEDMIKEDGKYYPVIKAVPEKVLRQPEDKMGEKSEADGKNDRQRIEDAFGPFLLAEKHPVLLEYLFILQKRNQDILKALEEQKEKVLPEKTAERKKELQQELADIEQGILLCTAKED